MREYRRFERMIQSATYGRPCDMAGCVNRSEWWALVFDKGWPEEDNRTVWMRLCDECKKRQEDELYDLCMEVLDNAEERSRL